MNKPCSKIKEGLSSKLEVLSHLPPEVKAFGCALAIIMGMGCLTVAGVGGGGYLGSFSQLNQVQSMVMMITGTGGGIVFLTGGIIATVKNCQKKKKPLVKEVSEKKRENQMLFGIKVPKEIYLHIFSFFPGPFPLQCINVCKYWKILSQKIMEDRFIKASENLRLKKVNTLSLNKIFEDNILHYVYTGQKFFLGRNATLEAWILDQQNGWNRIALFPAFFVMKLLYAENKLFSEEITGIIKIWEFNEQKKELKCTQIINDVSKEAQEGCLLSLQEGYDASLLSDSLCINENGALLFRSKDSQIDVFQFLDDRWQYIQTSKDQGNPVLYCLEDTLFSVTLEKINIWQLNIKNSLIKKANHWYHKSISPQKHFKNWPTWGSPLIYGSRQTFFARISDTVYIWNFDSKKGGTLVPLQSITISNCCGSITSLHLMNKMLLISDEKKVYFSKSDKEKGAFQNVHNSLEFSPKEKNDKVNLSYHNGKLIVSTDKAIDVWAP